MTAPEMLNSQTPERDTLDDAIAKACARIAPAWPLDRQIAVNPWWPAVDSGLDTVHGQLTVLMGGRALMSPAEYRALWRQAGAPALAPLLAETGCGHDPDALMRDESPTPSGFRASFAAALDAGIPGNRVLHWTSEITERISQFCGDYARTPEADDGEAMFPAWRAHVQEDVGLGLTMGRPALSGLSRSLPRCRHQLMAQALADLDIPQPRLADYFQGLLLEINGWASWAAYRRWQAGLAGQEDHSLENLLAIRVAYDWLLWRLHVGAHPTASDPLVQGWRQQWQAFPEFCRHEQDQAGSALAWLAVLERMYQRRLLQTLTSMPMSGTMAASEQRLTAIFCIDVRSERLRRSLEAQSDSIRTQGFAGFFGLPMALRAMGEGSAMPHLPGLLAPSLEVEWQAPEAPARWPMIDKRFLRGAISMFPAVEATGLRFFGALLRQGLTGGTTPALAGGQGGRYRVLRDGRELDVAELAGLLAPILRAMQLQDWSEFVFIVGHGSLHRNNPQAAALHCGACGGQTGEHNARLLAWLLNQPPIRECLAAEHGLTIPGTTRFVAGLHDTVSDDLHWLDGEAAPADIQRWLEQASAAARRERAGELGLKESADRERFLARGRDWSQVRPEWGLANNAAFIIAPRHRTRGLDLEGRSFLHDYVADRDPEGQLLELIMTAPMVVTHWINFQYYASTVDPRHFGSGNKVLHNVVGGNIGVFEGNAGDLRIGLSWQSVHDGERFRHQPLRLTVVIDAPRERIAGIVQRHGILRQLVDNEWLYLVRFPDNGQAERYLRNEWQAYPSASAGE